MSKDVLKLLEKALAAQGRGDMPLALERFNDVLKKDAKNVAALYSIGTIYANQGADTKAADCFVKATSYRPSFAEAWLARSILAMRHGHFPQAHEHLEKARALNPSLVGLAEHDKQLATMESLVKGTDDDLQSSGVNVAQLMRALALQAQGEHAQANSLLNILLQEGGPNYTVLYSLGLSQQALGNTDAAVMSFLAATDVDPSRHESYHALGSIYSGLGLLEKALEFTNKALEINPLYKEAFINKSVVLIHLNRHIEAIETLQQALEKFPEDQGLWNNYGSVLSDFKLHQNAADAYKRLLIINPNYDFGMGLFAFAQMHACNWSDYLENKEAIIDSVKRSQPRANSFSLMTFTDDVNLHIETAKQFGEKRFPSYKEPLWKGQQYSNRRKKIAFLSSDFREHPVGYLFIGLAEGLNKAEFESIGVSFCVNDNSELHKRYRCGFSHFWDCNNKPAREIAELLLSFQVDLVVDLSGYTAGSRLDVLAMRPAPVQATYLGYPGTLGLSYVDYLIADPITVPVEFEDAYAEQIIRLPHCYLPRDTRMFADGNWRNDYTKDFFGLPKDRRILCSFNHDYKINPPMFDVWMRLLRENSDSVLWLMRLNDDAQTNLKKEANSRGVDPARLIFAQRVPSVYDHLSRYEFVDLCLDTFPYNGHTTTSDALAMGAPLVSLRGQGFASRVAASLLHDSGSGHLCVDGFEAYFDVAQAVLSEPSKHRSEPRQFAISLEDQVIAFEEALREMVP